jgi:hypothetical protein
MRNGVPLKGAELRLGSSNVGSKVRHENRGQSHRNIGVRPCLNEAEFITDRTNPLAREGRRDCGEWLPDEKAWLADQRSTGTLFTTDAKAAVPSLRRRMIDDMSRLNLSPVTNRLYIRAVKRSSQTRKDFKDPSRAGRQYWCAREQSGWDDVLRPALCGYGEVTTAIEKRNVQARSLAIRTGKGSDIGYRYQGRSHL